jgi:isopenicillin-N N-acyltransferase-like protein
MKIIELRGGYYEIGRQHARQVQDLRPRIMRTIRQRVKGLEELDVDLQPVAVELASVWGEIARPTLEMLRGIADGLELKWDAFFRYTIASYLEDRVQRPAYAEGCTVWAASNSVTRHGAPLLAKTRDTRREHQFLQCLVRAHPFQSYRYLYVTSAGSPAVFSSGINEAGLAVADTHVSSLDIGPGVARYSAMMEILEHHNSVASALTYLCQVPHIGDGTLVLADRAEGIAVFEAGHSTYSIILPERDFVVSTNHFCGPQLRDYWADRSPPELQGNSQNRFARVTTALEAARGEVDSIWARKLMGDHGGSHPTITQRRQQAICRHSDIDPLSTTVSTALFLPQERTLLFADGQPCRVPTQTWPVIG